MGGFDRNTIDAITDIVCLVSGTREIIDVNKAGALALGLDRKDIIGRKCFEIVHRATAPIPGCPCTSALQSGAPRICEYEQDGRHYSLEAWPIRDLHGRIDSFVHIVKDISGRKQVETELREREAHFKHLFASVMDYVYTVEIENGQAVRSTHGPGCQAVTGYSPREYQADAYLWFRMVHPDDRDAVVKQASDVLVDRGKAFLEHRVIHRDGSIRWVRNTVVPQYDQHHRIVSYDSIIMDITERKQAEEKVEGLLNEKSLLLKEVHHRIKNNMSMIAGLLSLQAGSVPDKSAADVLLNARGRVLGMMLMYDKLYRSAGFQYISAREYLLDLLDGMRSSFPISSRIAMEARIDDGQLDSKILFPLGIIVNELATNACKYAFPDGRAGRITVSLSLPSAGAYELSICDDGIGLPESVDIKRSTSFGFVLIRALTEQLGGRLELKREAGTEFRLRFPAGKSA